MKHIIKTSSPENFEKWKVRKKLTNEDLLKKSRLNEERETIWKTFTKKTDIKNEVKESLLKEQGEICCYCQQRIELNENSIIEHFIARATDATEMFNYQNILACCDGGQKQRTEQNENQENAPEVIPKYCGHAKGNDSISINPLDNNCETHFQYIFNENPKEPLVKIEGLSKEGQEVITHLKLDLEKFNILRGEAVSKLIFDKIDDENYTRISDEDINSLISILKERQDGKFIPFCIVLEQVLKNQLGQNYVF